MWEKWLLVLVSSRTNDSLRSWGQEPKEKPFRTVDLFLTPRVVVELDEALVEAAFSELVFLLRNTEAPNLSKPSETASPFQHKSTHRLERCDQWLGKWMLTIELHLAPPVRLHYP